MQKFTCLTETELKNWVADKGHKSFRANQLFQWVYQHKIEDWLQMNNLAKSFRSLVADSFSLERISIENSVTAPDGTIKFLQRLEDGHQIETVILKHEHHETVCISTQVGCAMNCKFCLTATMGLIRDLSAGEIVDQVLNVTTFLPEKRQARNIVFMGMGEPFHNYENTLKALSILQSTHGLNYSSRRVTVSTSGLIPEIIRFGQEEVKANLAISLNGVTQEARKALMPVSKRYSLERLIEACKAYPQEKRQRITFEYILLSGLTDSLESAKKLVSLLHGIKSKVNLIPYNESKDLEFKSPAINKVKAFQKYLLDHGVIATQRVSRGQGISAACGQLAIKENKVTDQLKRNISNN